MFVLNSDITIGKFRFSGVHDVRITTGIHSIVSLAYIQLPAVSRIIKNGKAVDGSVVTADQFAEGDAVTVKLGYNGDLRTEFMGYVKYTDLNKPLTIICEGGSWLMRRNKINLSERSVSVKQLLQKAVAGTGLNVVCDIDVLLNNLQLNGTGVDMINAIHQYTDHSLTIFFSKPDTLYCGNLRTKASGNNDVLQLGKVQYRSGFNIFSNNNLKRRTTKDDPVAITYSKKEDSGNVLTATSAAFKNAVRKHSKLLNQVKEATALKLLAEEKAYKYNYQGFEGSVQTFLVPYVQPGCLASLTDNTLKLKEQTYLAEAVTTHFGVHGARRTVDLGPLMGFANQ